jgi:hypothetical protein
MISVKTRVLALFILFAEQISLHAHDNVEYYRHMIFRASPYGSLMGRHPVQPDKIEYGQHFRIYKDDQGRTSKIEYWFRKANRKGGYERFGAIGGAAKLVFTYDGNKIIRTYQDEAGKPMINSWQIASEEIELDKEGHKKSMIYKNLEGERVEDSRGVWEMKWQVSKNGKEVIESRVGKDGMTKRFNNFLDFGTVKMIFDDNGLRWETWNIDEQGNNVLSPKRQVAGVFTTWDTRTRDEKQITWVDTNGNPKDLAPFEVMEGYDGFCTEIYVHDENGNDLGITRLNDDNDFVIPAADKGVYDRRIFDRQGFLIDQRYFNSVGVPAEQQDGIARIELIRNDKGLVTQVRRYGLNGELKNAISDGVAIIDIEYTEDGQFKSRTDLDKDGNVVER